jgi:putative transposase
VSRTARIVVPFLPHHIVQRGHRRQTVFPSDNDFERYLCHLGKLKTSLGCRVYAFCLMKNHVHLVVDPGQEAAVLASLMQRLAGWHTVQVNAAHQWKGTLWEGRFKSSPIDTDRYLVTCCRYVENNPVRAGLVVTPEKYPWSSSRAREGPARVAWLDDPPIKVSASSRQVADSDMKLVQDALRRGLPIGDHDFFVKIGGAIGRNIIPRAPGRPLEVACEEEN